VLGVIGGSGFERLADAGDTCTTVHAATPYGSVDLLEIASGEARFFFWSRHGEDHIWPPHRVLVRAGLWALAKHGVTRILATQAVGTLVPERLPVGTLALVEDVLDATREGRPTTFFDGPPLPVVHLDASHLYCADLRTAVRTLAAEDGRSLPAATLAVTEGPRLETPAEIRALSRLGADVVGMTGMPEAALAGELGLCYGALALCTNPAAGLTDRVDGVAIEAQVVALRDTVLGLVRRLAAHRDITDAWCDTCHPRARTPQVAAVLSQPIPAGGAP